ncbi:ParB/RepB/Spo0J family partition protein [Actinophytocola oryzae]|uniref:ParB-like chromosome segregation protein Spo0J n=1 Tax=Actinophytocola oryzae TaxID=502181 RepID=A0A4R7VH95_9PSEU|nr:ParB N-terminal domain-containing protein [Actinophytocola oryzae]TDV48700.1 ParB-like chromosome segregation protein Spo0J [Actinophytocola oryzae]
MHVRTLAESDIPLPPIVVHRPTMCVIDGRHRLRAAHLRGEERVSVTFFDGDERDAFVLSVLANTHRGLPLSDADRRAAVRRIVLTHAHWSDGAIAAVTGLSSKTIAGIRACATTELPELHSRIGRDGRTRPLSTAAGREAARLYLEDNPDASLREVARVAGIAPGTVRDVRARLRRGDDPIPPKVRAGEQRGTRSPAVAAEMADVEVTSSLRVLRSDPVLRFSEHGRWLLRALGEGMSNADWEEAAAAVPGHLAGLVVGLARENSRRWAEFAEALDAGQPAVLLRHAGC